MNDDSNKNKNTQIIGDKYRAIMLLHALGDTIGFKNGDWEFNYHDREKLEVLDYVNEMIYEFIDLGGVNGIDLSEWKISDDTFLHIALGNGLMEYSKKDGLSKKLFKDIKSYMYDEALRMWNEAKDEKSTNYFNRYIGITTSESIDKFTPEHDARDEPYDERAGGNGCAMRTPIIGMCFFGEQHRDTLIELSIISSQFTHNNALGYLGGFNAALFTALGIEQIPIEKWPYILINYLKSDALKKILSLNNLDEIYDYNQYIRHWQKYLDTKFDKNNQPIKIRANTNPMHRIRYYHDNFHKGGISDQIGSSGYLCVIMAYDSLLDCSGCWEKLIVYAILHNGDSDTVGAVAGALYGSVYGFGDVPLKMLDHIERKDELENLAKSLYDKFNP
jgi:ADP-ribosylarginine hydrolase